MIVYNVTIQVQHDTAEEWVKWMQEEHIADVLSTGLFTECRLCRMLEQDETDGITYSAQYVSSGMSEYNNYINNHAPLMREKGFKRFGNKFIAFRSIMETL
jgi:hypothetical protein